MKRNRRIRIAERFLSMLLALLLFLAGFQGARAMLALPYWQASNWQQTMDFEYLLHHKLDSVMHLINGQMLLNGSEDEISYLKRQQLQNAVEAEQAELDVGKTWFRYQIKSVDGEKLYYSNMEEPVKTIHYSAFQLGSHTPGSGEFFDTYFGSNENGDLSYDDMSNRLEDQNGEFVIIEYGVPGNPSNMVIDEFCRLYRTAFEAQNGFDFYVHSSIGLLIGAGVCFLIVLLLAGRRAVGVDGELDWGDRISLEPSFMILLMTGGAAALGLLWMLDFITSGVLFAWDTQVLPMIPWMIGGLGALAVGSAALLVRSVILRLMTHTLIKNTWLCRIIRFLFQRIGMVCHAIPAMWRVVLAVVVLLFSDVLPLAFDSDWQWAAVLGWLLIHGAVLLYLCRWAVGFRRVRDGAKTIAAGNLSYQIETDKMPLDLVEHSEDLNNISRGMSREVDEKMKSERFKAELITNVSHDLKTPLTSIINYVNLLKTTEQTDPKALEYIEVLERKSQRLKKLTEDLVEASKASTGVLNVQLEKISMVQLLDQALGEWQDKLNDRDLTVVTTAAEEELWVHADGRHLWRVIDNLLSNCCKYAMEGTRIYVDLARSKGQVVLSVKNVSREQLNVPAERLMERFVRGEESRSTEGSGLGLSIARSLTELQGGTFQLSVDGDLFKAVVSLPQAA